MKILSSLHRMLEILAFSICAVFVLWFISNAFVVPAITGITPEKVDALFTKASMVQQGSAEETAIVKELEALEHKFDVAQTAVLLIIVVLALWLAFWVSSVGFGLELILIGWIAGILALGNYIDLIALQLKLEENSMTLWAFVLAVCVVPLVLLLWFFYRSAKRRELI